MAVQTVTLLAAATSLAPGTFRRPTAANGAAVPTGLTWYKLVIDISQMLDPATHFEFRAEFSLDGGTTWFEYGGAGRDGGQGFDRPPPAGTGNPLNTTAVTVGQSAVNPNEPPLPGANLPPSQRRARALLVTSGGTFTLGPITLFAGTPTDSPPVNT